MRSQRCLILLVLLALAGATGCSSLTNPVANGIPVRLVPDELLAQPKEQLKPIPLDWLRTTPPEIYTLETGDIIGVYVEGALGDRERLPPINFPDIADLPPSIGFPIPVLDDGTVSLPLVKKVKVDGLSIPQAQDAIIEAYTAGDKVYLQPEEARILVSLVRPRRSTIHIIREDSPLQRASVTDPGFRLFGGSIIGPRGQGTGSKLELPATEADILTVLASTGGLPGPDAANELIIYRGHKGRMPRDANDWNKINDESTSTSRKIRIPLRMKPGVLPPFGPEDVLLKTGDIVFIPARDTDVYYTGGLMPSREVPLPRDYDLTAIEAILRAGAPVNNGGQFFNINSSVTTFGLGNPSPSLLTVLRRAPDGGQFAIRVNVNEALRDRRENVLIMPGDVLLLQETPAEAVSRYVSQVFDFQFITEIFRTGSAVGQGSVRVP